MANAIRLALVLCAVLFMAGGAAYAAGGGSSGGGGSSEESYANADPNYVKAVELVKAGQYGDAIPLLMKVVQADPGDADAFNYLGYSHRKLGQFDEALAHYQSALDIEPKHRGANEYLGELYLQMGDLAKAEERLSVLDKACFFGCEEYSELKEAIQAYKAMQEQG